MIHKHWAAKYGVGAGILLIGSILIFWIWKTHQEGASPPLSFDGSSEALQQTVILPTLDTPIPEGKSAIWCASFQMAWNKLKSLGGTEPLRIHGAEAVGAQLNNAEETEEDLNPEIYYAAAGLIRDGTVEKIKKEMAEKFPHVQTTSINQSGLIAVAYAYLQAEVKFQYPYLENRKPFLFAPSEGEPSSIRSFGVHEYIQVEGIRHQVETLYCNAQSPFEIPNEFALDLCKSSAPNQIVLATIGKKETLKSTLRELEKKTTDYHPEEGHHGLSMVDSLLIPTMNWKVEHRFKELEGEDKKFLNTNLANAYIDPAIQVIAFKLDRSGASISSQSEIGVKGGPRHFHFNRPFLLYMKKRGAQHPFFVMWVDNAELLIKS